MDVVGLVKVEELVEALLTIEERVIDDVINEVAFELLLFHGVLVSCALPSQPLQQRFDDLDLG